MKRVDTELHDEVRQETFVCVRMEMSGNVKRV